nr:NapC/NirT family cytochrome c [Campylobacter sp.]
MEKTKLFTIAVFVVGGLVGLLLAVGILKVFHATGDDEFCGTTCHVMKPMLDSYAQDLHGDKNRVGVKADCVACHLPHDSVLKYALRKTYNGIAEFAINTFGSPEKYDWERKRNDRRDFVYDSGCMTCHSNVQNATSSNLKSFLPHRDYFSGISKKTCVECHENVGHNNLGFHLKAQFSEENTTK